MNRFYLRNPVFLILWLTLIFSSESYADLIGVDTPENSIKLDDSPKKTLRSIESQTPRKKPPRPSPKPFLSPKIEKNKNCDVVFRSDSMEALKDDRQIELIGSVRVSKCDMDIQAEKARIYFNGIENKVSKIVAYGKIKVSNIDKALGRKIEAYGNTAYYFEDLKKLKLLGNPAKVKRGQSQILGKDIVYDLISGRIKVSNAEGLMDRTSYENGDVK